MAAADGAIVSIDTTSPRVAEHALGQGASIVNCIDPARAAELGALCAKHGAALVIMHCRGSMTAMLGFSAAADSSYTDVVTDVARELGTAAARAIGAGLAREEIGLDPGFGFAKNARHSLALVANLGVIGALGYPLLVGPSRKSFLAHAAATEAREAGFLDAIKKFPNIKILSSDQYAGATRETSYQAAQNLLNRFGREVNGVFAVLQS